VMFGLYSRLIAVALVLALLGGVYWRGYTLGGKAVRLEWQADIQARTAAALQAEQAARNREAELQTKVGKVDRAYQDQKRATATVAAAAGVGLRHLEDAITRAGQPASDPSATSGIDGEARAREVVRKCAAAVRSMAEILDQREQQLIGLQSYVAGVCVK
jgi:hypothetical protein